MSAASFAPTLDQRTSALVEREAGLQRLLTACILTGLFFMLLPGTFLGVWNLVMISNRHALESLSPAWIQAHGHAQVFGWMGTFILGIGFYSLSKMGNLPPFAIARGWTCFGLWTSGLVLRWFAGAMEWQWRVLLPASASLELVAFLLFFLTVSRHRPAAGTKVIPRAKEPWMIVVVASTIGFLITLIAGAAFAFSASWTGEGPAVPHLLDQRLLVLPTWGFLVLSVWGFNARWLPVFLGLRPPRGRVLYAALFSAWLGVAAALFGFTKPGVALFLLAALLAVEALGVFERAVQPAKISGVHPSFPLFVRTAYVWLLIAASLSLWASSADQSGGIWGASRHALTVGFLSTMVFAIGQRILPAFCGARVLFSAKLMFGSLVLLNIGCFLRVTAEILAYEGFWNPAWSVLPVSAVIELSAVTVFAINLGTTLWRPPAHLMSRIS